MPTAEHLIQAAIVAWANANAVRWPELRLLYAIPNHSPATDRADGARLNAEGRKAGVPDLCLPVARGGWHGLYIEVKTTPGQPSPAQVIWLDALHAAGYLATVCHGQADAIACLTEYLTSTSGTQAPP